MQLILNRTYEATSDGARAYYWLTSRLELSEEEQQLVARYKLMDHVLTPGARSGVGGPSTIGSQMKEERRINSTLPELVNNEQILRNACAELPALFDYCRSFGVAQIVEYRS
jgi:hypothetical protein